MKITLTTERMATAQRAAVGAPAEMGARAAAGTAFEALLLKQLLSQALPAAGPAQP